MKKTIFLSFSKEYAAQVAEELRLLINRVFGVSKVDTFYSNDDLGAGDFFNAIQNNIKKANFAISILTPENTKNAPWLMFEAGGIVSQLGWDRLMPFLFCRNREDLEAPLQKINHAYYHPSSLDKLNKHNVLRVLNAINDILDVADKLHPKDIENELDIHWEKLSTNFSAIAKDMYDKASWRYGNETKSNTNIASDLLTTIKQTDIDFYYSGLYPNTPADLENYFEQTLNASVPKDWQVLDQQTKTADATRVLLGNTRISTFVCFTDGEYVLIFDRAVADAKLKNVVNDKLDVFGSVQFENRSLALKIPNQEFLKAPILEIKPIYGAAIEQNKHVSVNSEDEVVVMFGILAIMDSDSLALAAKNLPAIKLFKAITLVDMGSQLTAKARLAISSVLALNDA